MRNGHLNTIYPTLFRKQPVPDYHREELTTFDDDFLDVDTLFQNNNKLVVLCHGLEGSSQSQYIMATADLLSKSGWDVVCINYRSCSGRINKQRRMYHSGATYDLDTVIKYYIDNYKQLALVGFSLGGNLVLKYSGERAGELDDKIRQVVSVSVPVDLLAGSLNISKKSNFLYQNNFLKSLTLKIKEKHRQFPDNIDLSLLKRIKTLYDFDDYYTGPLHGYKNARDYYAQCSSQQFLGAIDRDTLIINALDDPFLPEACYPYKEVAANPRLQLITPKYGGHVGFVLRGERYFWIEKKIASFLDQSA